MPTLLLLRALVAIFEVFRGLCVLRDRRYCNDRCVDNSCMSHSARDMHGRGGFCHNSSMVCSTVEYVEKCWEGGDDHSLQVGVDGHSPVSYTHLTLPTKRIV